MKTVLVTGAAGFIGSHTVDRLLAGTQANVIAVDDFSTGQLVNLRHAVGHSRFRLHEADVCQPDLLDNFCRRYRPDSIVHLAGLVSVSRAEAEPDLNYRLNVEATQRVAEAARRHGVRRVVFASSAACYGNSTELPLAESQTPRPISLYGTAKLASEHLLMGYARSFGIEAVCLRYFNVFGHRQAIGSPYSGVITNFAEAFANNRPVTLHGNGTQTRDFIAVDDVARANAIAAMADAIEPGVRNICSGIRYSLLDVLAAFQKLYRQAPNPHFGPRRTGDIQDSCGDPQRARWDLGFSATKSVEDGLRSMIEQNRKAAALA